MIKKRILFIDDEEDFTKFIKLNLEETGKYEVRTENKGVLGLAAAKDFQPNLIFLDVMMPDIDGGDVCYQLENDEDTKNIPVVFLTAAIKKDEVDSYGGIMGKNRFIAKPVDVTQLIDFIEKNAY
ncbi:MAG: response regulator [Candidatus Omnitrophota bacterium]|jgi:CheY-like chemotaxis protein